MQSNKERNKNLIVQLDQWLVCPGTKVTVGN